MTEYIERDMLCRVLERYRKAPKTDTSCGVEDGMELALNAVKAIHTADVAPVVHGRWERDADGDWYCTNCDEVVAICESGRERTYRKPYCPNCGAKMDNE